MDTSPPGYPQPEQAPARLNPLEAFLHWCFEHWLALLNTLVLLYGGLPWLAPLLVHLGQRDLGILLFRIYTPLCHQIPGQSFFLFGHQVAFCQRETAMYTALFVGGLVYGLLRHRLARHPISMWLVVLLVAPLVIDGGTHTIDAVWPALGLRGEYNAAGGLNWWLRLTTGTLFALAVVLGIYPHLDRGLRGIGEPEDV